MRKNAKAKLDAAKERLFYSRVAYDGAIKAQKQAEQDFMDAQLCFRAAEEAVDGCVKSMEIQSHALAKTMKWAGVATTRVGGVVFLRSSFI